MRYLILCDAHDEPSVVAEAEKRAQTLDQTIILSPRRGRPWKKGAILNLPITWALRDLASDNWDRKNRLRKAIALTIGLRGTRLFGGVDDLFKNIEAGDPDLIDLRKLGAFGRWLQYDCECRFPGRKVISLSNECRLAENAASWRTYDRAALVSIILPVYNGEKYLAFAIQSCLSQSHKNLELIIVDDGSEDNTSRIVKTYAELDRRVKPLRNDANRGLPESLNVGFSAARGCFLTWTSDDNLYAPVAIEYMVQQLCTFPDVGLVYCCAHPIDDTGNLIHPPFLLGTLPPTALARWAVIGGCFLYRREVMEAVGPYRPKCRYFEDWDFFIRACQRFPAKHYSDALYFYRRHNGSLTSTHGENWRAWRRKLHDEHFSSLDNQIILPRADQLVPIGYDSVPRPITSL